MDTAGGDLPHQGHEGNKAGGHQALNLSYRVRRFVKRYWPLLLAALSVVASLCFAAEAASRTFWPTSDATITSVAVKYYPHPSRYRSVAVSRFYEVTYAYEFADRQYSANKPGSYFDFPIAVRADGSYNVVGRKFKLWVNPADPRRTTLNPGDDIGHGVMLILLSLVLACGIGAIELGKPLSAR